MFVPKAITSMYSALLPKMTADRSFKVYRWPLGLALASWAFSLVSNRRMEKAQIHMLTVTMTAKKKIILCQPAATSPLPR